MRFGECFKHPKTSSIFMYLGCSEDKLITYISIAFRYNKEYVQVGFVPYSTEVLDGFRDELEFIEPGLPNLDSLTQEMNVYENACNKIGMKTFTTIDFKEFIKTITTIILTNGENFKTEKGYHFPCIYPYRESDLNKLDGKFSASKIRSSGTKPYE